MLATRANTSSRHDMAADEQKDLALLENVELRFALAESDAQLQKMVDTFVGPLLLKLGSPFPSVRNKIMALLAHINKRIKPKPTITLPVATLAKEFANSDGQIIVHNFMLIYMELGFDRIENEKAVPLLPLLVRGISRRTGPQKTKLLQIILQILAKFDRVDYEKQSNALFRESDPFNVEERAADVAWLLAGFRDVMLYSNTSTPLAPNSSLMISQAPCLPPGLSGNAVKLVTNERKASWATNLQDCTDIKMGILRFVTSEKFFPAYLPQSLAIQRFFVFLAATCDSQHSVVSAGGDGLRRTKSVDYENAEAVLGLYTLYLGTPEELDPGNRRAPANPALKLKILHYLQKSRRAANLFPQINSIIFPTLFEGDASPKIRGQIVALMNWVAKMAEASLLRIEGKKFLEYLWLFIDGRRAHQVQDPAFSTAYVAVGQFCKRVPEWFTQDTFVLQRVFEALQAAPASVRTSIQEGLSIMLDAVKTDAVKKDEIWNAGDLETLETMLEAAVQNDDHISRYCAVKCATCIFSYHNPFARYICLLASTDERLDVRELARHNLVNRPIGAKQERYPSFAAMVSFINRKSKSRQTRKPSTRTAAHSVIGFSCETYTQILMFLRRVMYYEAHQPTGLVEEEFGCVDDIGDTPFDLVCRASIRSSLEEFWNNGSLKLFIELLEAALSPTLNADATLEITVSSYLTELVSLGPSAIADSYSSKTEWLKTFLNSPRGETRYAIARVIGIVATSSLTRMQSPGDELLSLFDELLAVARSPAKEVTLEHRHGAHLALGTLVGRALYRRRYADIPNTQWSPLETRMTAAANVLSEALANASRTLIYTGSCTALGEAGRYSPLLVSEQDPCMAVDKDNGVKHMPAGRELVDVLIKNAKSNSDTKVQELVVSTLAQLALGDPSLAQPAMELCYWMASEQSKQIDVHFTVGESVSCIVAGWDCTLTRQYLDIPGAPVPARELANSLAENLLAKLQAELIKHPKVGVRRAASVWLLCLVKNAAANSLVKQCLPQLYRSFSALLADHDDFVQEVASKGVGLVYELTESPDVKRELVQSLVGLFSEGKKLGGGNVSGETQILDSNVLGPAPDGSKIDTYRSILSLASDMNSPDLVYKFMQLASHNAVWQSRKGAAFGFASIMAKAEAEMQPYLATFVPKLYRYQFDPIPKVNEAMSAIWRALIKDPRKAVDDHFDLIIQDIIANMGNNQWRMRQSSCLALAELLPARDISQLLPYLEQTWMMCFRALDDIKESVRLAAFKACRALTNITIKHCDASFGSNKNSTRVLEITVIFLLQKGILSDAEDVKKLSLGTLLEICKKAGFLLRPQVPDILCTLLEGLSSFEPQVMNYLSFHVEKHGISQEQLEASRFSAAKTSPIMEGIESCIDSIDEKTMTELAPRLLELMRKAAGLPTKAGCARVVTTLAMRKPTLFQRHADAVIKAISGVITDRSPVVRRSYATTLGHTVRLLPTTGVTLAKFFTHIKKIYLENPEDDIRSIAGISVLEITRHAQEQLKAVGVEILPFAFFAARDPDDKVKSTWQDVWEENTGGSTMALKLYVNELLEILGGLLSSNSWSLKRQAALTIVSVVDSLGQNLENHTEKLLSALTETLAGRTWDGKESVLDAYVSVCVACREAMKNKPDVVTEMTKIVVREANKNNMLYRRYAIDNLGKFLDAYNDVEVPHSVKDELMLLSQAEQDENDMDEDDAHARPVFLLLKSSAIRCLVKALPKQLDSREVVEVASLLAGLSDRNVWSLKVAALDSLAALVEKLDPLVTDPASLEAIPKCIQGAASGLNEIKHTVVIESGVRVLTALVGLHEKNPSALNPSVIASVRELLAVGLQGGRFKSELEDKAKQLITKLG